MKINIKSSQFLIVAGGALLLAIIGYLLFQNSQLRQQLTSPESSTAVPLSDETANWKTYVSEDNTFSFKYPSKWTYETKKTTVDIKGKKYNAISFVAGIPLTEEQRKMQGYLNINDAPKTYNNFSLIYTTDPDFNNLTLDDLFEEIILKFTIKENVDLNKNVLLSNNIKTKEVGYGCQAYCIDILFKINNTIFDSSTGPNAESNISTLRQILQTFQFIE